MELGSILSAEMHAPWLNEAVRPIIASMQKIDASKKVTTTCPPDGRRHQVSPGFGDG
jgi:hypothetical protein